MEHWRYRAPSAFLSCYTSRLLAFAWGMRSDIYWHKVQTAPPILPCFVLRQARLGIEYWVSDFQIGSDATLCLDEGGAGITGGVVAGRAEVNTFSPDRLSIIPWIANCRFSDVP